MDYNDVEQIIHVRKSTLDQIMEKAKKWDSLSNSIRNLGFDRTPIEIGEWEEKAKKWDSKTILSRDNTLIATDYLNKIEEKAKKWDQVKKMQISSSGRTLETELAVNPPIIFNTQEKLDKIKEILGD